MAWELRPVGPEKDELLLTDEPSYIHALKMAPESREPELDSNLWLVVVFPVWSGPVQQSVSAAIACAKEHAGAFRLGIRPFNSYEENYTWWPVSETPSAGMVLLAVRGEGAHRAIHISTDPSSNPIWLVLRDGQVIYKGAGPRSKEQLSELMQTILI